MSSSSNTSRRDNSPRREPHSPTNSTHEEQKKPALAYYLTQLYLNCVHSKTQLFFLLLGISVICISLPMMKAFHEHVIFRRLQNPNYGWPKYSDLWISLVTFMVLTLVRKVFQYFLIPVYMKYLEAKHTGDIRIERATKAAKAVYKSVYFISITIFGFYVLGGQEYMPRSLLGSGDLNKVYKDFPFQKKAPFLDVYYMIGLGFHFESLVSHTLSKPRNDYVEMMLHHVVTVFLIFLSYMSNYSNLGAIVLFLHDWSDICVSVTRSLMDLSINSLIPFSSFIIMITVWGYTRLYVLPFEITKVAAIEGLKPSGMTFHGLLLQTSMLLVLQVLHIYWFCLFLYIAYTFIFKKKKEDLVNQIQDEGKMMASPSGKQRVRMHDQSFKRE